MENKKANQDKQQQNEGFSSDYVGKEKPSENPMLNKELEVDEDGNEKVVDRARNADGSAAVIREEDRTWNENESLSRGVDTEEEAMKTVENEDLNSDITAKRYPASHPENHINRGNADLDSDKKQ